MKTKILFPLIIFAIMFNAFSVRRAGKKDIAGVTTFDSIPLIDAQVKLLVQNKPFSPIHWAGFRFQQIREG